MYILSVVKGQQKSQVVKLCLLCSLYLEDYLLSVQPPIILPLHKYITFQFSLQVTDN